MKKLLLVGAVTLAAAQSYAQDYQAEIGLKYSDIDYGSAQSLFGEVYFDKVDTSKGPLAEAAFLDKASGITIDYTNFKPDAGDSSDTTSLDLRYVASEKWIIEANYESGEDDDTIGFGFGAYLTDNIDLVGHYKTNDNADYISVTMHGVAPLDGSAALSYDLGLTNVSPDVGDSESVIDLGVGYYFNKSFGVGIDYSTTTGDLDISSVGLEADWFVTETVDLTLSYVTESIGDFDFDTVALAASVRF